MDKCKKVPGVWEFQGLCDEKRANKKKNKHSTNKEIITVPEGKQELPEISIGASYFYTKVKFVFYFTPDSIPENCKDSMLLSLKDGRNFVEDDIPRGEGFIRDLEIKGIQCVEITIYDKDPGVSFKNSHESRVKKVRKFLLQNRISSPRIFFNP